MATRSNKNAFTSKILSDSVYRHGWHHRESSIQYSVSIIKNVMEAAINDGNPEG